MSNPRTPLLRRFSSDESGNIAMIFALAVFPVAISIGAVVDYTQMSQEKAKLQAATDAVVLSLGPKAATLTAEQIKAEANKMLKAYKPDGSFTVVGNPTISPGKTELTIRTQTSFAPMMMSSLATQAPTGIQVESKTVVSKTLYEIALVMDNSGSMASSANGISKVQAAKNAAKELVSIMWSNSLSAERIRISLVPFTLTVNVGPQYATSLWMDREGRSPIHWQNLDRENSSWKPQSRFDLFSELNKTWGGCVEHRPGQWGVEDLGLDTLDHASLFVPQFAPDEPGDRGSSNYDFEETLANGEKRWRDWSYPNSYIHDDGGTCEGSDDTRSNKSLYVKGQNKLCKYRNGPTVNTSSRRGPNYMCDALPLTRLTRLPAAPATPSSNPLTVAIDQMRADGNTNLLEGFMWGWRTLSPNAPFGDGKTYGEPDLQKIIILMTDGENAWNSQSNHNKSVYSPFGYYTQGRLTPQNGSNATNANQARDQIDAKTLEACANAKKKNITIYTVGFSTPGDSIDAKGLTILRQCASDEKKAYVATDGASIVAVFNEIAKNIGSLRIAH